MNDSEMKHSSTVDPRRLSLAVDSDGRLYNPQVRELMGPRLPADALLHVEAISALGFAARLMHLEMERWAEVHGLSEMRLGCLFVLHHMAEGMPLGHVASKLHVSPRNVTGLIDNLERDGLVARVPDPSDRRSVLARLTDRGRERIETIGQEVLGRQRELLAGFSPEELAQLRHLCLRVVSKMKPDLHIEN